MAGVALARHPHRDPHRTLHRTDRPAPPRGPRPAPQHHDGATTMTRFTGQASRDLLSIAFFGLLVLTPFVV